MRLIDADELKERIRNALGIRDLGVLLPPERAVVEQIDRTPTIQPEIVRCKDCERYNSRYEWCDLHCFETMANGYCHMASKKEVAT